jgi:hypothetical protein
MFSINYSLLITVPAQNQHFQSLRDVGEIPIFVTPNL